MHVDTNLASGDTSRGGSPARAHTPFTPVGGFYRGDEQGKDNADSFLMNSFSKFFANGDDSGIDSDMEGGSRGGNSSPASRKGGLIIAASPPLAARSAGPQQQLSFFGATADELFDDPY